MSDPDHPHDHAHDPSHGHGHTHGIVDPSIATSGRGLWAIKWSFAGLAVTAALQLARGPHLRQRGAAGRYDL